MPDLIRRSDLGRLAATFERVPRTPRCTLPDGHYHVTSRGNRGAHIFLEDVDRLDFLDLLSSVVDGFAWHAHAHCLMGTHYHLIVEASQNQLSAGMRRLNGVYAIRFNRRYRLKGHLFEARFSSYVLRDEEHFAAAMRYVLENPVRAGLCQRISDWQWSAAASPYRS